MSSIPSQEGSTPLAPVTPGVDPTIAKKRYSGKPPPPTLDDQIAGLQEQIKTLEGQIKTAQKEIKQWTREAVKELKDISPESLGVYKSTAETWVKDETASSAKRFQNKYNLKLQNILADPEVKDKNAACQRMERDILRSARLEVCALGKQMKALEVQKEIETLVHQLEEAPAQSDQKFKLQGKLKAKEIEKRQLDGSAQEFHARAEVRGMTPSERRSAVEGINKSNSSWADLDKRKDGLIEKLKGAGCDRQVIFSSQALSTIQKDIITIENFIKGTSGLAGFKEEVEQLANDIRALHLKGQEVGTLQGVSNKPIKRAWKNAKEDLAVAFSLKKEAVQKKWQTFKENTSLKRAAEKTTKLQQSEIQRSSQLNETLFTDVNWCLSMAEKKQRSLDLSTVMVSQFPREKYADKLKDTVNIEAQAEMLMKEIAAITINALESIPAIEVNPNETMGEAPQGLVANNYPLRLPADAVDEEKKTITLALQGKEETIQLQTSTFLKPIVNEQGDVVSYEIFSEKSEDCIYDSCSVISRKGYHIMAVADGSGLNEGVGEVAKTASKVAVEQANVCLEKYLENGGKITLRNVGAALVYGIRAAQEKITTHEADKLSTTLHLSAIIDGYVVTASIGDGEGIVFPKEGTPCALNQGARGSASIIDSGGAISTNGKTDLRDFHLSVRKLNPGDVVVIGSDGLMDGMATHVSTKANPEIQGQQVEKMDRLKKIILEGEKTPEEINKALMVAVEENTKPQKVKELMANPTSRPDLVGGKSDHVTTVTYRYNV